MFSDLGRVKHLKDKGALIGVGGCVASQEGAAIVERAPYVDLVFGPQTLHRLPAMLARRRASSRPQVDISFPEIEKFDHLPPARVDGPTAFVSIMEGCSKYCSYCVVPYTRGEEVSRPFDDVLVEVAGLADQGVREVTLLGQNVNAYRGAMGGTAEIADFATLLEVRRRDPRDRADPLHDQPSEGIHAAPDRRLRPGGQARRPRAPAGAARQRPDPGGDEARLHRARIQEHGQEAARRASRHRDLQRLHRRLSRRDRRRLRADDGAGRGRRLRPQLQLPLQPAAGHAGRRSWPTRPPHAEKLARLQRLQARIEAQGNAISALARSAASSGSWSRDARATTPAS